MTRKPSFWLSVATACLIGGHAHALTAIDEPVPDGTVSYTIDGVEQSWTGTVQRFRADNGRDTISGYCETLASQPGFGLTARECGAIIFAGNRAAFPTVINSADDLFLNRNQVYFFPVATVAGEPAGLPVAVAERDLAGTELERFIADAAAMDERIGALAAELETLRTALAAADDSAAVAAVNQRITDFIATIPNFGALATAVGRLEEFRDARDSGVFTEAALATFDERVSLALGDLPGRVAALESGVSGLESRVAGFDERISAVEGPPLFAYVQWADGVFGTDYAAWYEQHPIRGGAIGFLSFVLAVGLTLWVISLVFPTWTNIRLWKQGRRIKSLERDRVVHEDMLTGQDKRITDHDGDLADLTARVGRLEGEVLAENGGLSTVRAIAEGTSAALARHKKEFAHFRRDTSGFEIVGEERLQPCLLKDLDPTSEAVVTLHAQADEDLRQWELTVRRTGEQQFTVYGALRQTGTDTPLTVDGAEGVISAIYKAAKKGRLSDDALKVAQLAASA